MITWILNIKWNNIKIIWALRIFSHKLRAEQKPHGRANKTPVSYYKPNKTKNYVQQQKTRYHNTKSE